MVRVAVVTDSSGSLPVGEDVVVVPLHVVVGDVSYCDGAAGATSADILAALSAKKAVTTSRASVAEFAEVYARLASEGYDEILSVHVSGEVSGTVESATLAAAEAPVPVVVLDSRAVGPCLGLCVQAAVHAVAGGASAEEASAIAIDRANRSKTVLYVDSLEFLRRGGRIGARAALVGSALAVKPLLAIEDGQLVVAEKVRTASRALARLEDVAVDAADDRAVEVVVAHSGAQARAEATSERIAQRVRLTRAVRVAELPATLAAHVGPGTLTVTVAPALED